MRSSAKNRGKRWEAQLDAWHRTYNQQGRAYVVKTPPAVKILRMQDRGRFLGCFESAGAPDYHGVLAGRALVFDAKRCAGVRLPYAQIPRHQAVCFGRASSHGALAFLALSAERAAYCVWWSEIADGYWRWSREGGPPASILLDREAFNSPAFSVMPATGWLTSAIKRIRQTGLNAATDDVTDNVAQTKPPALSP